jgi:hypothetical protein
MRKTFAMLALLGFGSAAMAADNGVYLGASIGQADAEVREGPVRFDGDDTGFKIIGGLRPLDWLGIEANYVNFGKIENRGYKLDADAFAAYAVGFLDVGPIDLFAKGGVVNYDASVSRRGVRGRLLSDDGTDLAYGVGVQFRLLSLSLRAEYEVFKADRLDDMNLLSVGFTYTFL